MSVEIPQPMTASGVEWAKTQEQDADEGDGPDEVGEDGGTIAATREEDEPPGVLDEKRRHGDTKGEERRLRRCPR